MDPRPLRAYARDVRLADPVRWGDVEAGILALPVPPDEAAAARPPAGSGAAASVLLIVITVLPSALGLAFAAWMASSSDADGLVLVGGAIFVASFAAMLTPGLTLAGGRREAGQLASVVVATVLAAAAAVVLLVGADAGWLPWAALAATAAGVVSIVRLAIASPPSRHGRLDASSLTQEDRWRYHARAAILGMLLRRDELDASTIDAPAMMQMPLGGWRDLDRPA